MLLPVLLGVAGAGVDNQALLLICMSADDHPKGPTCPALHWTGGVQQPKRTALTSTLTPDEQERALPTLGSLLRDPGKLPDGLISGAVDLVSTLLAPASLASAQRIHQALSDPIVRLAETSDDPDVIRSCCTYLRYTLAYTSVLMPRQRLDTIVMAHRDFT